MSVTGDWSRNFSAAANVNPFVDPDLAMIYGSLLIDGGTLKPPNGGDGMIKLVGKTYGNILKVKFEWWASAGYDRIGVAIMDDATTAINYAGHILHFAGTTPILERSDNAYYPGHPDSVLIMAYPNIPSLVQGDELELEINRTTRAFTLRHKGVIHQTSAAADTVTDSVLTDNPAPAWYFLGGEVGDARIRSIAVSGILPTTPPAIIDGPTVTNINAAGLDVTATVDQAATLQVLVTAVGASQPSDAAFNASAVTINASANTPTLLHHTGQ